MFFEPSSSWIASPSIIPISAFAKPTGSRSVG